MKTASNSALAMWCALLCSFVALNCFNDPMTPVAPKWDIKLTVPLSNREVTLDQIVSNDSTIARVGLGNQLLYSLSASAPPSLVGDQISMRPTDASSQVELGAIAIVVQPVVSPISFPGIPPGLRMVVDPGSYNVADINNAVPTFGSVVFASGTMTLILRNNLPVPIQLLDSIKLLSPSGQPEASFYYAGMIPANDSRSVNYDLSGRSLESGGRITNLNFSTPGSNGALVNIPPDSLAVVQITTSNLLVSSATVSSIPAQRLIDNDVTNLPLQDSTMAEMVRIKSGLLNFSFTSNVNMNMRLKFRLSELLRTVGGQVVPYEDSISISARGRAAYPLNLAGCRLQSTTGDLLRSLQMTSSVIIPTAVTGTVTVNATDRVDISFTAAAPIVADSAVAVLKPTWVSLNAVVGLDFGKFSTRFSGHLNIPSATLVLNTNSSIGYPMDMYIRLAARRGAVGDSVFLQVPPSARRVQPGTGAITFDGAEVGQFLSQLSQKLPDSIRITGSALVNPQDAYTPTMSGVGRVGSRCAIGGTMRLSIPMNIGIVDGMYRDTVAFDDTNGDGSKESNTDRDQFNNVNTGRVFIEVQNALPIQVSVSLRLLDHSKQSLLVIPQAAQVLQASGATVDAQGNVIAPAMTTLTFELNQQEVQQFVPAEYVTYAIGLETSQGSPTVSLRTSDYVRIRAWSEFSYRVNQ